MDLKIVALVFNSVHKIIFITIFWNNMNNKFVTVCHLIVYTPVHTGRTLNTMTYIIKIV